MGLTLGCVIKTSNKNLGHDKIDKPYNTGSKTKIRDLLEKGPVWIWVVDIFV